MMVTQILVHQRGAHDHVSVWIDGQLAGNLIVGDGEGQALCEILQGCTRLDAALIADLQAELKELKAQLAASESERVTVMGALTAFNARLDGILADSLLSKALPAPPTGEG